MDVNELNARRKADGQFGSKPHGEAPAVRLPPAGPTAEVDATTAAMQAMAEDLMTAEGAPPITEARARVCAAALTASDIARSCVAGAKTQIRQGSKANATMLTVAAASVSMLPSGLLAAGEDMDAARTAITAARADLAAKGAQATGQSRSGVESTFAVLDERLAAMDRFFAAELEPSMVGNQPVPAISLAAVKKLEAELEQQQGWSLLEKASTWAEAHGYETEYLNHGANVDYVHCHGAIFISEDGEWEIGVTGTGRRNSAVDSAGNVDQMDYEGDEDGEISPLQVIFPWKKEQAA